MLTLLACIVGVFFGLYFNVLVMLPVCLAGIAIFVLGNLVSGQGFHATLGELVIPFISGQAGYMLGLTGRDVYGQLLARFHAAQSNRI